jgi:hypothetical protein
MNNAFLYNQEETAPSPQMLFDGPFEFFKPGLPQLPPGRLQLFIAGVESLAIITNLPQSLIRHAEAAEQIVIAFGIEPAHLIYLHRMQGGSHGLHCDLFREYAFTWEWQNGTWKAVKQTYFHRLYDEKAANVAFLLASSRVQETAMEPEMPQFQGPQLQEAVVPTRGSAPEETMAQSQETETESRRMIHHLTELLAHTTVP